MTDFLQRALKLNMIDFRDSVLIQRVAKVLSSKALALAVAAVCQFNSCRFSLTKR